LERDRIVAEFANGNYGRALLLIEEAEARSIPTAELLVLKARAAQLTDAGQYQLSDIEGMSPGQRKLTPITRQRGWNWVTFA